MLMCYVFGYQDVLCLESYDSFGLYVYCNVVEVDCYVQLYLEVSEVCNKLWQVCSMVCMLCFGICFMLI